MIAVHKACFLCIVEQLCEALGQVALIVPVYGALQRSPADNLPARELNHPLRALPDPSRGRWEKCLRGMNNLARQENSPPFRDYLRSWVGDIMSAYVVHRRRGWPDDEKAACAALADACAGLG